MADSESKPRLHPSISAALERDGVSLARIAELVGLDRRTVSDVRLDGPTEERAAKYRALDAWIEGRAAAVEGPEGWRLESLASDGLTVAEGRAAARRLLALASELEGQAEALRQVAGTIDGKLSVIPSERTRIVKDSNIAPAPLTADLPSVLLPNMNAQLLQSVAMSVKARAKGKMVIYNQKVPPDFQARLERAAARVGLTAADYLRALVEVHSEAPAE